MTTHPPRKLNRRTFLNAARPPPRPPAPRAAAWAATGSAAASRASRSAGKKVIVIGIDGMDPRLSRDA